MKTQNFSGVADLGDLVILAIGFQPVTCVNSDPIIEPDRILYHQVITVGVGVCPNKRNAGTKDQKQRIVGDKVPDAIHLCSLPMPFSRDKPAWTSGQATERSDTAQVLCKRALSIMTVSFLPTHVDLIRVHANLTKLTV